MSKNKYNSVSAKPVKRFFVEMLTRDILVEDAILDLLDNCVDGITRSQTKKLNSETPYDGFWAKITVNKDVFEIEDNCGGIPWSEHDRAFRMGRPIARDLAKESKAASVGVYGIGMKRAIFKIGNNAFIWTQNNQDNYIVPISPEWISAEDSWDLDVVSAEKKMEYDGTKVSINNLNDDIKERFSAETFQNDLLDKIAQHYAMIIHKGFSVKVNNIEANPKPIEFRFASEKSKDVEVRPYVFKGEFDGVEVFLAVGLREPIPGVERIIEEQEKIRFSSDYAGWTVICNDRVVLYCDRSELTGWATAAIPRYHTQFIAISGVVEFRGDPKKLPTTTTKRGLDLSSSLYQQVLNRMRDGLSQFIDFTNKWKMREDEAKVLVSPVPSISFDKLKKETSTKLEFTKTKVGLVGEQYKPKLPMPPNDATDVRISYAREKEDVNRLTEELFEDFEDMNKKDVPRKVGEASFDFVYNKLVKKK